MRYSPQRESILKIVRGTDTHPTAEWIFSQTRQEMPTISLGTVYRNLNQLADHGLIKRIFDQGHVRYDGTTTRHDHFHCEICGQFYDVNVPLEDIVDQLSPAPGFEVTDYSLEITGTCPDCLSRKGSTHHATESRR